MDLIVDHLSHAYGSLEVLSDVSFATQSGEILGIIGPSGCGKSTLLSILGGLLQPSSGRIATRGTPPADSRNPLTFVFQDFALLPWRSVADNIMFPLEHRIGDAGERRAILDDVLGRTGLTEFRQALPKQLSGGMRQRVGIARALAVHPAILLMDEPLSALDSQTRDILIEDFSRLMKGESMSAIYVTHALDEAVRLSDRIIVFSRRPGRVREIVSIPIPRDERTTPAAKAQLAEFQARLWSSIRNEAADAEREIIDV